MSEPLLTRAFVTLTLSDLAYFTAAGVLLLATPLFASGPLGGDTAAVGLAMGVVQRHHAAAAPVGRPVDRPARPPDPAGRRRGRVRGRRRSRTCSSPASPGSSLVRLALGVAEACYFVAGFAALADLAPPARAGEALSLNSLALYVGIGAGPLLGQGVLELGGYAAAWWTAAGLAAVATGLALAVPETHGAAEADAPDTPLLHRATLAPGDRARQRDHGDVGLHGVLGAPRQGRRTRAPGRWRCCCSGPPSWRAARVRPAARPGRGHPA